MERGEARGLKWGRVALIGGAVVVLIGLVAGARALSAPVERAGEPTIAVPAPTGTRLTASATPTGTQTPTGTTTATETATEQPTTSPTPTSTMKSSGRYKWSTTTADAAGSEGTLYRYAVAVETSAKVKADTAATTIAAVLNDPRSWTGDGKVRFALVGRSKATVNVYLAGPQSAAELCGSDADAAISCTNGDTVVINAERWKSGTGSYADLAEYRTYLINHAAGQLLGEKAQSCPGKGKKAPVMMPQGDDLAGCTANPWP